jgi:hypothetical protein
VPNPWRQPDEYRAVARYRQLGLKPLYGFNEANMSRGTTQFERWTPRQKSTLPFQVFQKHNAELQRIWGTHITASRYVYKTLGASGAAWTDLPSAHFDFQSVDWNQFGSLKEWSDSFNLLDNWVNLNVLLTLSSNLETYMASVVALALESDPGILLGAPRKIDGTVVLKYGASSLYYEDKITACTKGEWMARLSALEKIFGSMPLGFSAQLGELEKLRQIRNRVGHAFGREIAAARRHGVREILPMETVSRARANKFMKRVWGAAKALDSQLIVSSIGEFEAIRFYHLLYPRLHKHVARSQRAAYLKKEIGKFGVEPRSKVYCKGLVEYYESL